MSFFDFSVRDLAKSPFQLQHESYNDNNLINEKIFVYGDSLLVINQINKKWQCKSENLISLYEKANDLLLQFSNIEFIHIKRELNKLADKLCNLELDKNN
jgi:ribonuclease HI